MGERLAAALRVRMLSHQLVLQAVALFSKPASRLQRTWTKPGHASHGAPRTGQAVPTHSCLSPTRPGQNVPYDLGDSRGLALMETGLSGRVSCHWGSCGDAHLGSLAEEGCGRGPETPRAAPRWRRQPLQFPGDGGHLLAWPASQYMEQNGWGLRAGSRRLQEAGPSLGSPVGTT